MVTKDSLILIISLFYLSFPRLITVRFSLLKIVKRVPCKNHENSCGAQGYQHLPRDLGYVNALKNNIP